MIRIGFPANDAIRPRWSTTRQVQVFFLDLDARKQHIGIIARCQGRERKSVVSRG